MIKFDKYHAVLGLTALAALTLATTALAVTAPATMTTLSFSKNPAALNEAVTATATVTLAAGGNPRGGKLYIRKFMVDGVHVSCGAYATAVAPAVKSIDETNELNPVNLGVNAGINFLTINADTSTAGSFGYGARYNGPGVTAGDSEITDVTDSQAGCVNLVVNPAEVACNANASGLDIQVTESTGSASGAPGTTYNGGFTVKVSNCTGDTIHTVTAQGGRSGWTTFTGASPGTLSQDGTPTGCGSAVIRNTTKKNEVVLWTIGDIAGGAICELDLAVTGDIKPDTADGTILYLSGPWSAINGDTKVKSLYSDRAFITVVAP